jgi:hypothetical protein
LKGGRGGRAGRGRWGSGSRLQGLSQRSSWVIGDGREKSKSQLEVFFPFLFFSSRRNRTMGLCFHLFLSDWVLVVYMLN